MIGLNSYCMFQFYFGSTLPWVLSQFLSHRVGSIWSYLIYDFQMSTNGTNSKTLGIPPFNSKPIEGKVWIDRVGYVPGESIIVSGHVVNKTGKRMRATKIRLVEVKFHSIRLESFHVMWFHMIGFDWRWPSLDAARWNSIEIQFDLDHWILRQ